MWSSARRRASLSLQVRAGGAVWAWQHAGRLLPYVQACNALRLHAHPAHPACLLFPSAARADPDSPPRPRATPFSCSNWALQRRQVQPHQHADGAQRAGHGLQDTRCAAAAAAAGSAAAVLPAPAVLLLLLLLIVVCCTCFCLSCLPVHCSASLPPSPPPPPYPPRCPHPHVVLPQARHGASTTSSSTAAGTWWTCLDTGG